MSIGDYAFQYCSSLTSIVLPAGLTSLGLGTFYGCSSMASFDLPAGLDGNIRRSIEAVPHPDNVD